jgi:hypothetical protein
MVEKTSLTLLGAISSMNTTKAIVKVNPRIIAVIAETRVPHMAGSNPYQAPRCGGSSMGSQIVVGCGGSYIGRQTVVVYVESPCTPRTGIATPNCDRRSRSKINIMRDAGRARE